MNLIKATHQITRKRLTDPDWDLKKSFNEYVEKHALSDDERAKLWEMCEESEKRFPYKGTQSKMLAEFLGDVFPGKKITFEPKDKGPE